MSSNWWFVGDRWLLVVGCWLLVVGCWLLVVGYLGHNALVRPLLAQPRELRPDIAHHRNIEGLSGVVLADQRVLAVRELRLAHQLDARRRHRARDRLVANVLEGLGLDGLGTHEVHDDVGRDLGALAEPTDLGAFAKVL